MTRRGGCGHSEAALVAVSTRRSRTRGLAAATRWTDRAQRLGTGGRLERLQPLEEVQFRQDYRQAS